MDGTVFSVYLPLSGNKFQKVLIAQLVEHRAENSGVVGSNPT